jgi:2-keto-4-pentenoate hydratase/2-oxohepta-3-ene-1,7-dioic acid hydratase in catechol pathway
MKLYTFQSTPKATPTLGVQITGSQDLVDVAGSAAAAGIALPFDGTSMQSLIEAGAPGLAAVKAVASHPRALHLPLVGLHLCAPLPRLLRNVYCVGWNYLDHFNEGAAHRKTAVELPEHPAFFTKASNSLNGPYDAIPYDAAVSEKIDWECELGLIIGKRGRNIPEAQAMSWVFGYTVINDVTARDMQRYHGNQWFKGKSLDGSCPMGPAIVTADAIADPHSLDLWTRVNGVIKQESNTRHLFFKLPRLIAELSLGLTLEPGDIISTGTPQGVGYARTPPEFLQPGDVLETEVAGIGVLRNVMTPVTA